MPPDVIDIMTQRYKSNVTRQQSARDLNHLCSKKRHTPPPPPTCIITLLERVTPLKMTSFLWIYIAHNVAKARLQSTSRLKEPSIRELQNASSDVATRRATPATRHSSCIIRHVKNNWGQSLSSPAHSGQHITALENLRRRMTLVIRRRRKSSHPSIRIFSRSGCFYTTRQRQTRNAASGASNPRRRRYISLVENLEWRHI